MVAHHQHPSTGGDITLTQNPAKTDDLEKEEPDEKMSQKNEYLVPKSQFFLHVATAKRHLF